MNKGSSIIQVILNIIIPKPQTFKIKDYSIYKDELQNVMNHSTISVLMTKIENCNDKNELNNIIKSTADIYIKTAEKISPVSCPTSNSKKYKNKKIYNRKQQNMV